MPEEIGAGRSASRAGSEVGRPERPDIETASAGYARRFTGDVGRWFLAVQEGTVLDLLAGPLTTGSTVLDVGGGHAQLAPPMARAGYRVTVLGSALAASAGLRRVAGATADVAFEVSSLIELPHADDAFDAVTSVRLLPHMREWRRVIRELCRVARHAVVVDYPSRRSVNILADRFFGMKKALEGNTRPYTLFAPREVEQAFEEAGYRVTAVRPQFFWPMVLHRALRSARTGRLLEAPARALRLTDRFGSPVLIRAEPMRTGRPPGPVPSSTHGARAG